MAVTDRLGTSLAAFCALVPIADEDALRTELRSWPTGAQSPLAKVPRTHFARFVVLPGLSRQDSRQPDDALDTPYLVFSAFLDGDPATWLAGLCEAMPDELDRAFAHCAGHPGHPAEHGHAFRRWLGEHRVPATQLFGAYPDASVEDVRDALAFRERFRAFAFGLEAQRTAKAAFRAFAEGRA